MSGPIRTLGSYPPLAVLTNVNITCERFDYSYLGSVFLSSIMFLSIAGAIVVAPPSCSTTDSWISMPTMVRPIVILAIKKIAQTTLSLRKSKEKSLKDKSLFIRSNVKKSLA